MNYRTLGKTGLKVSEIGCGTWQLANDLNAWVGADLDESLRSLEKFADLGGNFIDTAWIYGYDDSQPSRHPSEELIGKFLKKSGKRDKLVIATKVPPKNMHWPALKGVPISEVFPGDWIEQCVDDSLRSLGVDSIDLVQFHVWQDDFAEEDAWKETIQKIMKSGKVKFWGISINDYQPSNCLKTLDTGLISTIQFIFNIFHQKPAEKLLPYAKEHNIGLIARVPLDEGGLSGKLTTDTVFDDGEFRKEYFSKDRLEELVRRNEELIRVAGGEAKTLVELALRYLLSFDEVSTVIPGMRRIKNVEANTSFSDGIKLSEQLMNELKKHKWDRNFYPESWKDSALKDTGYIEE
ncbi:MAG: aldo/keto reductase [Candidatus Daviesbacteria bacterium]|nr:aldo/keto reductase [Candidatus Daviesbacteria bacterium]